MLFGEYHHQIDEKGRVRIPPRLKKGLGDDFLVTKGTHGCLFLFSKKHLEEKLFEKLEAVPTFDDDAAKPLRMLFSSAAELEEDNQGRCLLPRNLREFAKVKKDVVFIGVGTRAEVWAREEYDKYIGATDFDKAVFDLKRYGV